MRHALHAVGLAALLAAGSSGCEKAKAAPVKTAVLDEGSAPRHVLRYQIPAGTRQSIDMIMDLDMAMAGAGLGDMSMPRMIMGTDIEITSVDKDGAMAMTMTFTDVRVEDRPGAMAGVAGMMGEMMSGMRGIKMAGRLLPNGVTRDLRIDESTVPDELREQMRQTEQMVDQMTTILPDVAVGKGARWRVEQTLHQGGMKVNATATYQLLEVTEHTATIRTEIAMSAPPQTINQGGVKAKLERMTGSGSATTTLDFRRLVEGVDATIDMDMRMSAMGQSVDMSMKMGMKMVPTGAPAE
jgi:hypothetical protein